MRKLTPITHDEARAILAVGSKVTIFTYTENREGMFAGMDSSHVTMTEHGVCALYAKQDRPDRPRRRRKNVIITLGDESECFSIPSGVVIFTHNPWQEHVDRIMVGHVKANAYYEATHRKS